jgi:hypothetical protein
MRISLPTVGNIDTPYTHYNKLTLQTFNFLMQISLKSEQGQPWNWEL